MLQIIGWLGCLLLVVKALEIIMIPDYRDKFGDLRRPALAACILCWAGAALFAAMLYSQGEAMSRAVSYGL